MAFLKNKWALAAIAILCWAIIATSAFGYYYYQYTDLVTRIGGTSVTINLGIDYANGTRQWFNGTNGVSLYDAMLDAGWNIESTSFGVMGIYINSINGVSESIEQSKYWGWWMWTDFGWAHGASACDKYIVSSGETIILYYSSVDPTTFEYNAPP